EVAAAHMEAAQARRAVLLVVMEVTTVVRMAVEAAAAAVRPVAEAAAARPAVEAAAARPVAEAAVARLAVVRLEAEAVRMAMFRMRMCRPLILQNGIRERRREMLRMCT
ncbi:MAG: hypothetical protein LWW75_07240, partial [Chlorobiales bacterium]|nr:hypothetical protein [Chlorobiales bacterium]